MYIEAKKLKPGHYIIIDNELYKIRYIHKEKHIFHCINIKYGYTTFHIIYDNMTFLLPSIDELTLIPLFDQYLIIKRYYIQEFKDLLKNSVLQFLNLCNKYLKYDNFYLNNLMEKYWKLFINYHYNTKIKNE